MTMRLNSWGSLKNIVADPITMLKAKLHNLVELDRHGRNDRNHVEYPDLRVTFLKRQLVAADETDAAARQCLRGIQRILDFAE